MSHCDTCVSEWGKYLAIPLLSTVWYFSHYSDVCCGHIRPFCFRLKAQNVWSWLLLPSSGKSMERSLCGPLGGTDISKYVWCAVAGLLRRSPGFDLKETQNTAKKNVIFSCFAFFRMLCSLLILYRDTNLTVFVILFSSRHTVYTSRSQHFVCDPKVVNGTWPATLLLKRY